MPEAFCIASGPSLTPGDVERVRLWREEDFRRFVIVTNLTFRLAPWADALFAYDNRWLLQYMAEVRDTFRGEVYSASGLAVRHGVKWFQSARFRNSGSAAIALAIRQDARRVYLLGYDCQKTGGKAHWHDDYPKLGNAQSISAWPEDFGRVAALAHKSQVPVFNCTRSTALTMFPRASLEAVA